MSRVEHLSEDVTLYLGDCRDLLPLLGHFEAVVTDPPYGIGRDGQKQSDGRHGGRKGYDFLGWDDAPPDRSLLITIREISDNQVIWGGNYFADHLPPTMRWLVWDKGQRINQSDGELAWTNLQAALRIITLNRVAIMTDIACHPTQKPVEVMRWSIQQIGSPSTILDPFMGSGTTGVAAVDLGLKFTGIEREPKYFDIACRRISDAISRPRLPLEEPVKITQGALEL